MTMAILEKKNDYHFSEQSCQRKAKCKKWGQLDRGLLTCLFKNKKIYTVKTGNEQADKSSCDCQLPSEIQARRSHKLNIPASEGTLHKERHYKHRYRYTHKSDQPGYQPGDREPFNNYKLDHSENCNQDNCQIRHYAGIDICTCAGYEQQKKQCGKYTYSRKSEHKECTEQSNRREDVKHRRRYALKIFYKL